MIKANGIYNYRFFSSSVGQLMQTVAQLFIVQLNLNFTHACRHMCVFACLMHAKLQNLTRARTVACDYTKYISSIDL